MASPKGTPVGIIPQHWWNILNERCGANEFLPVQNVYGYSPCSSNVAQSSHSRSPEEDHVGTWQQGEILPTTPVQSFYGSGPRGVHKSTFSNSRSSQLQEPDIDLRLQEDNVEIGFTMKHLLRHREGEWRVKLQN